MSFMSQILVQLILLLHYYLMCVNHETPGLGLYYLTLTICLHPLQILSGFFQIVVMFIKFWCSHGSGYVHGGIMGCDTAYFEDGGSMYLRNLAISLQVLMA